MCSAPEPFHRLGRSNDSPDHRLSLALLHSSQGYRSSIPHVEPVEISPNSEGESVVKVHQVVYDPMGNLLADGSDFRDRE